MTQPTIAITHRAFWELWKVREVGSSAVMEFETRDLAVNYAMDLAGGNNRLVTVNGRALDDG